MYGYSFNYPNNFVIFLNKNEKKFIFTIQQAFFSIFRLILLVLLLKIQIFIFLWKRFIELS